VKHKQVLSDVTAIAYGSYDPPDRSGRPQRSNATARRLGFFPKAPSGTMSAATVVIDDCVRSPTAATDTSVVVGGSTFLFTDRALLLLAANGLSRVALVGLDAEHFHFTTTAVELSFIAGRCTRQTAGEGRGVPVVIRSSAHRAVCPVQALRGWLDASETQFGLVFRKIDRWGTLEHHRLGTDAISRILARRALGRTAKSHKALEGTREGLAG
jgi:hypothetical protein